MARRLKAPYLGRADHLSIVMRPGTPLRLGEGKNLRGSGGACSPIVFGLLMVVALAIPTALAQDNDGLRGAPPESVLAMGGSYHAGQMLLSDVDGDGMADLVFRVVDTSCTTTTVSRNCGRSCSVDEQDRLYCSAGDDVVRTWTTNRTVHCGRDETCTDHIFHKECQVCDTLQSLKVGISTGDGFALPTTWLSGLSGEYEADQVQLGDLNGDGRADLVFRAAGNTLKVSLSTGTGFSDPEDWIGFGGD